MSTPEVELPPDIQAELGAIEDAKEGFFLKIADYVSDHMGRPTNIIVWLLLVIIWVVMFAASKQLDKGTFLPSWFISTGFNFPLNLITTVCELFIGFLVAASTNRSERANERLQARLEKMEEILLCEVRDNTKLTTEVKTDTSLLQEIHKHVTALSPQAGDFPPTT